MHIGSIYSSILCHVCGTDGVEPSFTSIRDLGYTKEKQAKAYSLSVPWPLLFQKTLLCIAPNGNRTHTLLGVSRGILSAFCLPVPALTHLWDLEDLNLGPKHYECPTLTPELRSRILL